MPSPFASRTQDTIELPFDPGQIITIKKLPGRHLERAQQEAQFQAQEYITRMGGAEFRKQLATVGDDHKVNEEIKKAQADPLTAYDRYHVIQKGLVAWSYTEDDGKPKPITSDTIDDLDDEAVDFIARAILKLTKPELFRTEEEEAVAQKNV